MKIIFKIYATPHANHLNTSERIKFEWLSSLSWVAVPLPPSLPSLPPSVLKACCCCFRFVSASSFFVGKVSGLPPSSSSPSPSSPSPSSSSSSRRRGETRDHSNSSPDGICESAGAPMRPHDKCIDLLRRSGLLKRLELSKRRIPVSTS